MQENPNTENQTPHLLTDCEDWQIAFEPYEGDPRAALSLGFKFAMPARLSRRADNQVPTRY